MTGRGKNTIQILDEGLRSGFSPLPKVVLKAKGLSMQAKLLYALLLDYAWQKDSCFPGQERLAIDLDIHKNTVLKHLKELQKFGLISWKQRGLNKTNVYYILPLKKIAKLAESYSSVIQEIHPSVNQEIHSSVNLIEEVKQKKNKHKQSLTFEEKNANEDFDEEAIFLATELKDLKSIKFYQKLINQKNKGEIKDSDITKALEKTKEVLRRDQVDGTKYLRSPPAFFVALLKKIKARRIMQQEQLKIQKMLQKLTESKKL